MPASCLLVDPPAEEAPMTSDPTAAAVAERVVTDQDLAAAVHEATVSIMCTNQFCPTWFQCP
jgi:hypothetical protein